MSKQRYRMSERERAIERKRQRWREARDQHTRTHTTPVEWYTYSFNDVSERQVSSDKSLDSWAALHCPVTAGLAISAAAAWLARE